MRRGLLLTASLAIAVFMAGCGTRTSQPAEETTQTVIQETTAETTQTNTKGVLPQYVYPEGNSPTAAVADYMLTEFSKNYESTDVSLPSITIIEDEDNDPADVKIWGIFELDNYNLKGDTLETQSGGVYAGLMHITTDESGKYTVTSVDLVEDGSDFDSSAKEIFGKYYDEFMEEYSDDAERAETRKDFIEDYVEANQLPIKQFKDYGWDPVTLDLDDD